MSAYNLTDLLEQQELIQKLKERGHGELVEALLENENKVYTKKGRLNKSGACRVLGWKPKQLEDALSECREILSREFED
jgi:nucleoside-diphosphate-sugar epimerase